MNRVYFLFLSLIVFSCCTDKYSGPTEAEGQVIDVTTGKGVPDADVLLMRDKSGSATAMGRAQMDRKRTDANGNFSFSFNAEDNYYYFLDAEANHYYTDAQGGSLIPGEKNENLKVSIKPKGYIKFNLINDEPKDAIYLHIQGRFASSVSEYLTGDKVFMRDVLGNELAYIFISKAINGGHSEEKTRDSFFVNALDTVEYTIKY